MSVKKMPYIHTYATLTAIVAALIAITVAANKPDGATDADKQTAEQYTWVIWIFSVVAFGAMLYNGWYIFRSEGGSRATLSEGARKLSRSARNSVGSLAQRLTPRQEGGRSMRM